jgi:hypothetical protein
MARLIPAKINTSLAEILPAELFSYTGMLGSLIPLGPSVSSFVANSSETA